MRFGIGGTDPLYDGARIHLESQHGGCVRVTEDNEVDGSGKLDCRSFLCFYTVSATVTSIWNVFIFQR